MAARTTVKVALQTGAAKDDALASDLTGLTEDTLYASLNVLANDPGAARLYSLLQDPGSLAPGMQFPVHTTALLPSGAVISINADGTIAYDASGLDAMLQSYAEGEFFTDTFIYTARMANGALSTAQVTVQVAGRNDPPTLQAVEPVTLVDDAMPQPPTWVNGQLVGHDVDHGAVLSYLLDSDAETAFGTLTLDAATGAYSFDLDESAFDALGAGQTAELRFTVHVEDEHGASSGPVDIVINLVGADEAESPANPVTTYMVNYGLTDVNQRQTFHGFDSNDLLKHSKNYTYLGHQLVDTDGDSTPDSTSVEFIFQNGAFTSDVFVTLVGYTEFTEAQLA